MEQSYEIMECGTKAKSLNPVKEPGKIIDRWNIDWHIEWNKAESERVTYEIEFIAPEFDVFCQMIKDGKIDVVKGDVSMQGVNVTYKYKPGTIVLGILHNGKLRIK